MLHVSVAEDGMDGRRSLRQNSQQGGAPFPGTYLRTGEGAAVSGGNNPVPGNGPSSHLHEFLLYSRK